MEQRAVVILYQGNALKDKGVQEVVKSLVCNTNANVESVETFTLNSAEIAKLVVKKVADNTASNSPMYVNLYANTCIKNLTDFFRRELKDKTLFDVKLKFFMFLLSTKNEREWTKEETLVVQAVRALGKPCTFDTDFARECGYTPDLEKSVKEVYSVMFDKNGAFKK